MYDNTDTDTNMDASYVRQLRHPLGFALVLLTNQLTEEAFFDQTKLEK